MIDTDYEQSKQNARHLDELHEAFQRSIDDHLEQTAKPRRARIHAAFMRFIWRVEGWLWR